MTPVKNTRIKRAEIRIILPTLITISLFIISVFSIIIPSFRSNMMERKREMIRELTQSAWSILLEYANKEMKGQLTKEEAQSRAISDIRFLRYGEERKDYFWITDMHPRMVMHPYKPQLEGKDLSGKLGEDPTGKKLFVEMVQVCQKNNSGYVEYMWQWKDDPHQIVPKLSYVKRFAPWDWIIGTGIYIEDVKEEISHITSHLMFISLGIIFLISMLLFYMTRQSLKIEKQRQLVEANLLESENKYRALVEAATEGNIMILEGKIIHYNQPLLTMLELTNKEFQLLNLNDIIPEKEKTNLEFHQHIKSITKEAQSPKQFEGIIKKKNSQLVHVEITIKDISLWDKNGFIIIIRDIGRHKQMEEELGQSKEKYQALTNSLDIGVFRVTLGRKGKIIEANPAAIKILGFQDKSDLLDFTIFDFFYDKDDRMKISKELFREGFIKNRILEITKKNGIPATLSISAVLVKNDKGENQYCDGIIEDITQQKKMEEKRESLIVEIQTAQLFLNQTLHQLPSEILSCPMNTSIQQAAAIMKKNKASAILVSIEKNVPEEITESQAKFHQGEQYIGIITDTDLRSRVVAEGALPNRPIFEFMSSPIISIQEKAMIFEAILMMQEKEIRHLAVKNSRRQIIKLISSEQIMQIQRNSSAYILKEVHEAQVVEDIVITHNRLPKMVKTLIDSGANSKNICRIISSVADAITQRLVTFAIDELGPPPFEFAFIALGSEGREEQTLLTDQDNAIIFEDLSNEKQKKDATEYFLKLGEKVCLWLDLCGYRLCPGEIMAKNPKWCQPLSQWKNYFSNWINAASPQDLLEINIFFDFRCVFGQTEFISELQSHIYQLQKNQPAFFQYMARNALLYKPPIGFFGNIVLDSSGQNPSTFDIKESIKPIVNYARLYALKHNIEETNTQDRLFQLFVKKVLNKSQYQEMIKVYDSLMQNRFKHQATALKENRTPDNFINPKQLTDIEYTLLKNALNQINNFQKRLSYDFTGSA